MGAVAVEDPIVKIHDVVYGVTSKEWVVEVHVVVPFVVIVVDEVEEIEVVSGVVRNGSTASSEVKKIDNVKESSRALKAADGVEKIEVIYEYVKEVSEFYCSEATGAEKIGASLVVEEVSKSTSTDVVGEVSFYSDVTSSETIEKNEVVSNHDKEGLEATNVMADCVKNFVQ